MDRSHIIFVSLFLFLSISAGLYAAYVRSGLVPLALLMGVIDDSKSVTARIYILYSVSAVVIAFSSAVNICVYKFYANLIVFCYIYPSPWFSFCL